VNVSNFMFICIECDMRVCREWVNYMRNEKYISLRE
jgi:hypothetical protein